MLLRMNFIHSNLVLTYVRVIFILWSVSVIPCMKNKPLDPAAKGAVRDKKGS